MLFFCSKINAQFIDRPFRNISLDKGLSHNTVYSVSQDSLGFIWIGTRDGLNKYDGYTINQYQPINGDPNSIASSYISYLYTSKKGIVWIGGNGGLSMYKPTSNNFFNLNIHSDPGLWFISSITEDNDGFIWASTNTGKIFKSNRETNKFSQIHFDIQHFGIKNIYCLASWGKDLLIGTDRGLFVAHTRTNKLTLFNLKLDQPTINTIYCKYPFIWLGTEGKGLIKVNIASHEMINYRQNLTRSNETLMDNNVRSLSQDSNGNMWVGTFKGLSIIDISGKFNNYLHNVDNPASIGRNSIRCIYRDKQNGMWLGTFYGGVSYYHKNLVNFNLLGINKGTPSLSDNIINAIKQDKKGNFWIGTESGGLNFWERKNNRISYFKHGSNNGLSSNNIKSILIADDTKIFLGTHNDGLNLLDPHSKKNKIFKYQPGVSGSISGNMVYALLKDHNGRIWVGTRTGLDIFHIKNGLFEAFKQDRIGTKLSSNIITYLFEDSRNRIWIGTANGTNIFNIKTGLLTPIANMTSSYNTINVVAEDHQNRIWLGTRGGLNLYDENKRSFINYDEKNDLLKENINTIIPSKDGSLWITTNLNIIRYNPDTRRSQSFGKTDGLQNQLFNLYASCIGADGMLLFGGTNGVSYFYPQDLARDSLQLDLTFTGLEVLNRFVVAGDPNNGILNVPINETKKFNLGHDHKQFTIFFNTFNYISPSRTKYLYKLEGYDNDWQESKNTPKASYSNLLPGNYVFRVKTIGPQGEIGRVRTLNINIVPIWYRSNWFYLFVALAISAAAYFLYRILTERMRTLHQLKLERLQREKIKYINQIKTDFFTNISHELRTPLSLILAPLEEMTEQQVSERKMRRNHHLMLINTRRLHQLVNRLFEFRKTEMGTRRLQIEKNNIVPFAREIYLSFNPLAEKNNITYTFFSSAKELCFYFDKDAVENIMFNLLSNAFKYTSSGGNVELELQMVENQICIIVKDTGIGIDKIHQEHIFERFYQVDGPQVNLGSGVGLAFTKKLVALHHGSIEVKSAFGKGSIFKVMLPLDSAIYACDNFITDHREEPSNLQQAPKENSFLKEIFDSQDDLLLSIKETLLVVDDNEEIVQYLKEYFMYKYSVITACNGKEAIKLLDSHLPDIIISDIIMPEMDGIQLCKKIKQNIKTCHIPIILLTARAEPTNQIESFEVGADDHIAKPFSITVLNAKVQNIIRTRRRLKEYYSSSLEIVTEKIALNKLDEEFFRNAIKIVETNINDPNFSVLEFSRKIGMSQSSLYLKLKALTGESTVDFIRKIKFKKASELLEDKNLSITDVAYLAGFSSLSYFSTAFKQYFGCLPTEYLANRQAGNEIPLNNLNNKEKTD